MSTTPDPTNPPDNPHGIDHARERRLIITFAVVIGGCFVVAGIIVGAALMMDITNTGEETIEAPDFVTDSPQPPEAPAQTSHP